MTDYPIFYGTRRVTLDQLAATFTPHIHPEFARRLFPWIESQAGVIGIGSGYRPPGTQPADKPGFAAPGSSFHEGQIFPSGRWYAAVDLVATRPGQTHRAPTWAEVPAQGSDLARRSGVHCNIGSEPWHMQPVPLDGHGRWVTAGRYELARWPLPTPTPPPTPTPTPQGFPMLIDSRNLSIGSVGSDVRFYQRQLLELAGQSVTLSGIFDAATEAAVRNWQGFFDLVVDGQLGPKTQTSIIEISLAVS